MFAATAAARVAAPVATRAFSSAAGRNIAVLGAAGGIGQPLSLLLKASGAVSDLRCFDIVGTPGVAADLGHCSTRGTVSGHVGDAELGDALSGADIVVIPAGVPRKPGMTRDDLFNTNASIVQSLAAGCAKHCPEAHLLIISNPVNSTVPIVAETLKSAGVYDARRLFGVTTLDVVRARTFVGAALGQAPEETHVDVIGGHAGKTILPLLSKVPGIEKLSDEELAALTHRIQFGGDEVVQAKDGAGSATLSMAFAGAEFALKLARALNGETGITECAFVESDAVKDTPFFSTPVELTTDGVGTIHPVPDLSAAEQANFDEMVPDLQAQIAKGVAFAKA